METHIIKAGCSKVAEESSIIANIADRGVPAEKAITMISMAAS